MPIDVNCFIGGYPFRSIPHPDPGVLVRVLQREGVSGAWVGHLPSAFWRDPSPGNAELYAALAPHAPLLRPVPIVRPDWPGWRAALADAAARAVPAVRAYPAQWALAADGAAMRELALACGESGIPLLLTVRFEDLRQRHPLDAAADLGGAPLRSLARAGERVRLIVTGAGRDLVEEVHWGLTPAERARVWWDISWIWGPPEDHLAHLLQTIGAERFVYGSAWPLRLAQAPRSNLDLLPAETPRPALVPPGA